MQHALVHRNWVTWVKYTKVVVLQAKLMMFFRVRSVLFYIISSWGGYQYPVGYTWCNVQYSSLLSVDDVVGNSSSVIHSLTFTMLSWTIRTMQLYISFPSIHGYINGYNSLFSYTCLWQKFHNMPTALCLFEIWCCFSFSSSGVKNWQFVNLVVLLL